MEKNVEKLNEHVIATQRDLSKIVAEQEALESEGPLTDKKRHRMEELQVYINRRHELFGTKIAERNHEENLMRETYNIFQRGFVQSLFSKLGPIRPDAQPQYEAISGDLDNIERNMRELHWGTSAAAPHLKEMASGGHVTGGHPHAMTEGRHGSSIHGTTGMPMMDTSSTMGSMGTHGMGHTGTGGFVGREREHDRSSTDAAHGGYGGYIGETTRSHSHGIYGHNYDPTLGGSVRTSPKARTHTENVPEHGVHTDRPLATGTVATFYDSTTLPSTSSTMGHASMGTHKSGLVGTAAPHHSGHYGTVGTLGTASYGSMGTMGTMSTMGTSTLDSYKHDPNLQAQGYVATTNCPTGSGPVVR